MQQSLTRRGYGNCTNVVLALYRWNTLKNLRPETCVSYLSICDAFLCKFVLVQVFCTEGNAALFGAKHLHAHDQNYDDWLIGCVSASIDSCFYSQLCLLCKKLAWTCIRFLMQATCACVTSVSFYPNGFRPNEIYIYVQLLVVHMLTLWLSMCVA